jgi:hypothetical protein
MSAGIGVSSRGSGFQSYRNMIGCAVKLSGRQSRRLGASNGAPSSSAGDRNVNVARPRQRANANRKVQGLRPEVRFARWLGRGDRDRSPCHFGRHRRPPRKRQAGSRSAGKGAWRNGADGAMAQSGRRRRIAVALPHAGAIGNKSRRFTRRRRVRYRHFRGAQPNATSSCSTPATALANHSEPGSILADPSSYSTRVSWENNKVVWRGLATSLRYGERTAAIHDCSADPHKVVVAGPDLGRP